MTFLVLALLVAAPDLSKAPEVPPAPLWEAPAPKISLTLPGVRALVLPEHALPIVHISAIVRAGAALDPPAHPGLAALVAAFLQDGGAGTRSALALAQAFADLGTELEVRPELEGIRFELSVRSQDLETGLALLSDVIARPTFAAEEYEATRERAIAEVARLRDDSQDIANEVFLKVLYGNHPYGHPVLGTAEGLLGLRLDAVKAFYAAHYAPEAVSVLMVGDVSPEVGAKKVEKAFAGWKSAASPLPPALDAARGPGRWVWVDKPGAPQSELRVGYVGAQRNVPDFAALEVIQTVLGGSFTSRLNQNLREKHGYTYGADARFVAWRSPGPFFAAAAVRADATAPALEEMLAEIGGMRTRFTEEDLATGKALVQNRLVQQFTSGRAAADVLGDLLLADAPASGWTDLTRSLKKLDLTGVRQAIARWVLPEALSIVVVGDGKTLEAPLRKMAEARKLKLEHVDAEGRPAQ